MKRTVKNVGISDAKHGMLHFMFLMSNNPTSFEDDGNSNKFQYKKYLTKEERQRIYDEKIEEELKIRTEEDDKIDALKKDWEKEFKEDCQHSSSNSSFSSDDDQ